ncbi:bifunctional UDP-4-keto-pentose/UDP-xylose synthase [candidate division CSSED10-310 bacterium]|uniref:Bifunctional UDP-4-keto-pentose/UDP-xylose synthase n=1 Tax=candidate division CSSED10-310 bacterium TaxID=2855610 RepID=A0ABV6Z5G5_UNCC1
MKILNFGCAGFIGAHLTHRLLAEGHTVIGIDTHHDKIKELLDDEQFIYKEQDIRTLGSALGELVSEADLVIDLIAHANPGLYVRDPLDVYQLNFGENIKIAEACIQYQKRLIQFSSCEVYGKTVVSILPDKLLQPEDPAYATFSEDTTDFILGPINKHRWIYSCAKQLLERVLHSYGLRGDLNYTIIRPFNFIGPKIDYLPSETEGIPRVFSYFMEALIRGTTMKLVDGGVHQRCYSYIDDAVECIYKIIVDTHDVCNHQIFNIGAPQNECSIRELAELMCDIWCTVFSKPPQLLPDIVDVTAEQFYGHGYEDSDRRIPDITKAKTLLSWEPKCGLRDTLIQTMDYYISQNTVS